MDCRSPLDEARVNAKRPGLHTPVAIKIFLSVLLGSAFLAAAAPPLAHPNEVREIVEELAACEFDTVFEKTDQLRANDPDSPELAALSAISRALFINYYKSTNLVPRFTSDAKRAEDLLQKRLRGGSSVSNMDLFLLGGLLGYRGLVDFVSEGKLISAFSLALRGLDYLKPTIQREPVMEDTYFGLALFHYYRGQFGRKLAWLKSAQDDEDKAYLYINRARTNGFFLKYESAFRLMNFRVWDKKWDGLELEMQGLQTRFPKNSYLAFLKVEYFYLKEDWGNLLTATGECRALLDKEPRSGRSAYFEANVAATLALSKLGKIDEAKSLAASCEKEIPKLENWSGNDFLTDLLRKVEKDLKDREKAATKNSKG